MSFQKLARATAFILLVAIQGVHAASTWSGTSFMDSAAATGATKLHAVGITGKGVSVAVIDSPYAVNNDYIANNIISEASYGISTVGTYGGVDYSALSLDMTFIGSVGGRDLYGASGKSAIALPDTAFDNIYGSLVHGTHVSGTVVGMAPDSGLVLMSGSSMTTRDSGTTYSLTFNENVDLLMQHAAARAQAESPAARSCTTGAAGA